MTAITLARAVAPAKSISRSEVFSAQRALYIGMLAVEAIANHAAQGQDVEGEIADLKLHLERVVAQLDVAMG